MRKLRIFFMDNWGKILVTVSILLLILLTLWGLSKLESFYRNMTVATLPMQILIGGMHAMVFVGAYLFFMKGGFGKITKKSIKASDINVKFSDVIGLDGAKREAMEVVQLIKDGARVKKIGGKIVKGIILMGPPGCGKTLLAKAIATESKMPFLSISGSEFVEVFVGVGASRVRQLFQKARKLAYAEGACIVFIDEIEVIGRGRTFSYMGGGEETNSTQNQLLVELDGLDSKRHNIVVIGATNANESVMDKALLRPGRFDRKIYINLPNLKEREELFKFYLKKVKADPNIDVVKLAKKAVYKSPAEIENIIKESALIATRNNKDIIDIDDISDAIDRIDLGLESHICMTDKEKEMTAYHEAGHATTLYFLHPTDDVFKATIKSRGDALGLVSHNPKEELHTQNKEKLIADIIVSLAGYSSEKIKYGTTSTGVSSDFKKAMAIANAMVWQFGMGEEGFIGDFTVIPKENMSSSLKEKLNQQTMKILDSCLKAVNDCLTDQWVIVDEMAKALVEREELDYDDIDEIFAKYGKNKDKSYINTNISQKDAAKQLETPNA
ncbi:MAG: AAA family ATPase [Endomicrobiia bacterium]|nr:AAA family ATPase [Endomicrobiaceae bacterium]MDD3053115.1 AAA family ATPase [Endomicrobiaceae bacterium]MDD3922190.1 AAA family ATPase [Endomicrobiaceae bacterium]